MKTFHHLPFLLLLLPLALALASCRKAAAPVIFQGITYESVSTSETPFPMSDVQVPVFPDRTFSISDYGARPMPKGGYPTAMDSARIARTNSQAILRAMEACSASGGGHVVVPGGEWFTGAIQFRSKCDLYLDEGAELVFSSNPDDFLPEQMTTFEGIECYNYCPPVYAWRCDNIGISGSGTFRALTDVWDQWQEPTLEHQKALQILDNWGTFGKTFFERNLSSKAFKLRPPFIQLYQCTSFVLQDFKIRKSPFWSVHLFGCQEGVVRKLDISALARGNDGIDLEMSRRVVVEDCTFEQGGDVISVKSGRVKETWNNPESSRYILVRRCEAKKGKALLSLGEEISWGAHYIYMRDCKATGPIEDLLYVKTNKHQGSVMDSITVERCEMTQVNRLLAAETDVWGDWKSVRSGSKDSTTSVIGLKLHDIKCQSAMSISDIQCDTTLLVRGVVLSNVKIDTLKSFVRKISKVEGYREDSVSYRLLK